MVATLLSKSHLNRTESETLIGASLRAQKVAESRAWTVYLSRNPRPGLTPRTMNKISELGEIYLRK